ncbi:MAG: N-acetyltransferase [Betaproteobacteria bacterium]
MSVTHQFERAQDEVAVVSASTNALVREFVELPYRLYVAQPHWVPPLRRDEYRRLAPRHNPFHEHAEMALWIARAGGRTTGRIAAIEDRLHNETHGERVAWFGFFEAEDEATAAALLGTVEQWGRARGSFVVRGPANPSLNESAGLLVDRFDEDPYILMPYNPPTYPAFVEAAGYRKAKDLLAWKIDLTVPLGDRASRLADRLARRSGIVIRPVRLREFGRELEILKTIYRAAWQDNWGFVPPTDAEIDQLAVDLKPVLDPELVLFAEMDGRPVACAVAVPDANQVLRRMGGRLLPFGIVHFLRRRAIVDQARLLLLGVLPELRRIGLYPMLIADIHRRAVARGYRRGELSWTLEDNDAINAGIEAAGGRHHKTYRLYDKPIG